MSVIYLYGHWLRRATEMCGLTRVLNLIAQGPLSDWVVEEALLRLTALG